MYIYNVYIYIKCMYIYNVYIYMYNIHVGSSGTSPLHASPRSAAQDVFFCVNRHSKPPIPTMGWGHFTSRL